MNSRGNWNNINLKMITIQKKPINNYKEDFKIVRQEINILKIS